MSDVFPRIRVVSAPSATATVHADLMDVIDGASSSVEVLAQDFTLGQLDLEGDPDAIGVEWALQRIGLTQQVRGSKAGARFRMQTLARAFLRRRFWLMFQLDAETAPVWWHAYRTPPGEVDWESVYIEDHYVEFDDPGNDRYLIKGGVDVDPFAYSARVTHPVKVVGNDPAGTAPAAGYTLPAIRGDAPTRLRVKITPSSPARVGARWLVSCIASDRTDPVLYSPVGTDDGLSGSNADIVTDSGAIGGSARRYLAGVTREALTGAFPTSGAPAGQYQMLVRLQMRGGSGTESVTTMQARSSLGVPLGPIIRTVVRKRATNQGGGIIEDPFNTWVWVPLGVIGINDNRPDDTVTGTAKRSLSIWMGNNAGVLIDQVMLIPVSGPGVASVTSLVVESSGTAATVGPSSGAPLVVDGDDEVDWLIGGQDGDYQLANAGGYPEVDPAATTNVLLVLPLSTEVGVSQPAATQTTALAHTTEVEVSYPPRSVWLGDGVNPVTDVVTLNV